MATDPDQVERLFEATLSQPAAQRPQYLADACGPDTELRAAVVEAVS